MHVGDADERSQRVEDDIVRKFGNAFFCFEIARTRPERRPALCRRRVERIRKETEHTTRARGGEMHQT